jgi:hypothetical protein
MPPSLLESEHDARVLRRILAGKTNYLALCEGADRPSLDACLDRLLSAAYLLISAGSPCLITVTPAGKAAHERAFGRGSLLGRVVDAELLYQRSSPGWHPSQVGGPRAHVLPLPLPLGRASCEGA